MIIETPVILQKYGGFICGVVTVNGYTANDNDVIVHLFSSNKNMYIGNATIYNGNYMFDTLDVNNNYNIILEHTDSVAYKSACITNVKSSTRLNVGEQRIVVSNWQNGDFSYVHVEPYTLNIELSARHMGTYGTDTIVGFVEGSHDNSDNLHTVEISINNTVIKLDNISVDYEVKDIDLASVNYILIDNKLTPISYYTTTPQKKGYITGSVNNSCDGTDFKIRVYREDGFFIGDYDIAENGSYEIPNLNVHSSYDVLLYDLNLAVETQVNSRRVPTAYSATE